MKEVIGTICVIVVMLQPIIFIIGLINPNLIIRNRHNVKNRRMKIFGLCFLCFLVFAVVGGNLLPDTSDKKDTANIILCDTIEVSTDSVLVSYYKQQFDSLYNKLLALDEDAYGNMNRKSYHNQIQNLLYEKWWNAMLAIDSTHNNLPLSESEYQKACKLYDKQLTRFVLYGDEDKSSIRFWAKENANKALRKTLKDPNSLILDDEDIRLSKTKYGWKCIVPYRAKNGFGGYVVETLTLIMSYNIEEHIYKCVDIY
ncbi:hypothetical protein LJC72_05760 [Bacteroides sp. OttesenSCG-928-D19]|nr:hypothetical protein [Bacteroides sp. OttesenSCG-928-N06]MDL2304832.1 hypothetical protein [Bacteroides sp. OttesenSCG-928-D19]